MTQPPPSRWLAIVSIDLRAASVVSLPVATLDDLLHGKIWAASDPKKPANKRRKDLPDIERILEKYPELRAMVPVQILARLD